LIGSTADQSPKEALEKATMINIKFDFDERKFRREVEKAAQEGVDEAAKKLTRDIDRLRLQYQGRPVDTSVLAGVSVNSPFCVRLVPATCW
jgi:hypothetical protein